MGSTLRAALLGALLLQGCRAHETPPDASSETARPAAATALPAAADPELPPDRRKVATTDGAIARTNLDGQIQTLEKLVANGRGASFHGALLDALSTRGQLMGRIADYERALAIGDAMVRDRPESAEAYLARAGARSTLHLFEGALADLDAASGRGASPSSIDAKRAPILEAQGQLDAALALRHATSEATRSASALGAEAALLGQLGRHDEARALYREALAGYRDVSPFVVAWLFFQEGVTWERSGNRGRAKAYFQAALDRLPVYAHAAGHLAKLETPARAVAILRPLTATTDDPEIELVLAERLRDLGQDAEADALTARVKARYEELVARHPAAFADHAGWFYLGAGKDAPRALALARQNLAVRKDARAYDLGLFAAMAAGDVDATCAVGREGLAYPHVSSMWKSVAEGAMKRCPPREQGSP